MRKILALAVLASAAACLGQNTLPRPQVTGISHVAFYSTNLAGAKDFYGGLFGLWTDPARPNAYHVGAQMVELEPLPQGHGHDLIAHLAFATPDAEGMRKYLASHSVSVPEKVSKGGGDTLWFALKDPEGNSIEFVQERPELTGRPPEAAVSKVMIHVGFVVHDRAAEDKFYKDLLGFHLYWQGGNPSDRVDWVMMQVPDGTDWIEYMLYLPASPSLAQLGSANHLAPGVSSVAELQQRLEQRGWKAPEGRNPQILGVDGKMQLDLTDPDGTRIEFMEFKPVKDPCCSAYTGPQPGPSSGW